MEECFVIDVYLPNVLLSNNYLVTIRQLSGDSFDLLTGEVKVDGAVEAGLQGSVPTAGVHHCGGLHLDEVNAWKMNRFAVFVHGPVDVE